MKNKLQETRSANRRFGDPINPFFWAGLLTSTLWACAGASNTGTTPKPRQTMIESRPTEVQKPNAGSTALRTPPQSGATALPESGPRATRHPARNSPPAGTNAPARPLGPGQTPRPALVTTKLMERPSSGRKVTGLALGRPGLALATDDKRIHLLDPASGKETWASDPVEQTLSRLSFAASAPRLAAVGDQLSSYIWDMDQKKLFRTWHRKSNTGQGLSGDGTMLVREDVRHSVRWFELATYKMKWLVKGRLLGLSGDGGKALCINRRGDLELRGADRGRLVRRVPGWKDVVLASADRDAERVVTISASGQDQARTWDIELRCTGAGGARRRTKTRLAEQPLDLVVAWPVRLAVIRTAKGLLFWDLCSKKIVENRPMPLVAMAAFDDKLAVADPNGTVRLWRLTRNLPTCPLTCRAGQTASR